MEEKKFALGYIKSELDGTEEKFVQEQGGLPNYYEVPFDLQVIDQGNTPCCVSCSMTDMITRNQLKKGLTYDLPYDYIWRTYGGSNQTGMMPIAGLKGMVKEGYVKKYGLIENSVQMQTAIYLNGSCLIGLPVYNYGKSFWKGSGRSNGGHAVTLIGWQEDSFILKNSWGSNWGVNGRTLLPFTEMQNSLLEAWTIIL